MACQKVLGIVRGLRELHSSGELSREKVSVLASELKGVEELGMQLEGGGWVSALIALWAGPAEQH